MVPTLRAYRPAARTDDFDLTSFKGGATVEAFRTSGAENFSRLERFEVSSPVKFSYKLPPCSVTTLVIKVKSVHELAIPVI